MNFSLQNKLVSDVTLSVQAKTNEYKLYLTTRDYPGKHLVCLQAVWSHKQKKKTDFKEWLCVFILGKVRLVQGQEVIDLKITSGSFR